MVCKIVLQTELQKSPFCVRPWSLLTILNFSERGPTDNSIVMSLLLLVPETISLIYHPLLICNK